MLSRHSSTPTFCQRTVLHKVSIALDTMRAGTHLMLRTMVNTVAVIDTLYHALTATRWRKYALRKARTVFWFCKLGDPILVHTSTILAVPPLNHVS